MKDMGILYNIFIFTKFCYLENNFQIKGQLEIQSDSKHFLFTTKSWATIDFDYSNFFLRVMNRKPGWPEIREKHNVPKYNNSNK